MNTREPLARVGRWLIAALVLFGAQPEGQANKPKAQASKSIQSTILPQRFVRQYDPITVVFASAVGPKQAGVEAQGERWLQLKPKRNGTYRWIDQRTLEFRPAAPWPAYSRVTANVPARAASKQSPVALAPTSRGLVTLLPSPTKVEPASGASDQRQVRQIKLTFGQAVPSAALRRALQLKVLTLPGVGSGDSSRTLAPSQWWLKRDASPSHSSTTYRILFRQALPKASTIRVLLRLALPAKGTNKQLQQPVWSSHFRTMHPFYLTGVKCAKHTNHLSWGRSRTPRARALDCGGGAAVPTLIFSRPLSTKTNPGSLKRLFRISPIVAGLKISVSGRYVRIHGQFRRDALYRLTLEGGSLPIVDNAGQRLQHQGRQTLFFFLGQKRPFLRWRVGQGLLERHGPQMMPLHTRSIARVDLRIHPIKANDRRFWPFPKKATVVNEGATPPKAGTLPHMPKGSQARNGSQSQRQKALMTFLRSLGSPLFSGIVHLPTDPQGGSHHVGLNLRNQLKPMLPWNKARAGIKLPQSNQFLVGLRLLDGSKLRRYARLQVTDLALTTVEERDAIVFAVTSIKNASAIKGATILVEGPRREDARTWDVLWKGTTDNRGLARLVLKAKQQGYPARIRVQKGQDQLLLDPHQPPPVFVNEHWSPASRSWLSWTEKHITKPIAPTVQAHVFTERPVYRPGEPVHIKGIVRQRIAGKLALPNPKKSLSLRLDIVGPKQQRWIYDDVKISASGSIYRKFSPQGAPNGAYFANLIWMRDDGRTLKLASRAFRIEAYKLPLFEVQIHAPQKAPADKPFKIAATARYYAGGLVVSQPIKWRVIERVISYRPPGRKGFYFASNIRYSRGTRSQSKLLIQKSDKIDSQGHSHLQLDPTKSFDMRARRYSVEAVVKGPDGRDVTGYKQIKVLPPFAVGVKIADRFRLKPGPVAADLIAVGIKGKLKAGIPLKVQLLRREWHAQLVETDFINGRTRYRTEVVDRPIKSCQVTTKANSPVNCALNAKAGGVYVLRVEARDKMGRLQRVSIDMFVQGKQPIAWERSRNSTFKLSLSKRKYSVGQTARVLIRSPFQKARALAIIEDPAGVQYRWVNIEKGKGLVEIPVTRRLTPSLRVHVVVMRGRVAGPLKRGLDPGKPKTAVSSIKIPIDPKANRIMLAMKWPKQARPRQWVEGLIQLKTPDGKPLSGEVTLWAVDRAALSLGREARIHPLKSFVVDRAGHLRIRDTRNLVIGRLAKLADRSGGGGGGRRGRRFIIRKNFKTVPYYNPAIQVGPSGKVKVRFQLPDDLTTFAIRAVAVSGPARFGYVEQHLLVQLPVMVQRTLPQFVRPGDQLRSGGFARIVSGKPGQALAQIMTQGAKILGDAKRRLMLKAKAAVPVLFDLFVPARARDNVTVQIKVRRLHDNERDAFEVKIPVKQDRRRVYILKEQMVSSLDQVIAVHKKWPEAIRKGSGKVEILMASSDAVIRAISAMEYLLEYPYGCIEQQVSRARPMLVLESINRRFALRHLSSGRTRKAVESTLEAIKSNLHRDGTVGYWPGSKGSVWLTAYATALIVDARRAGYSYPQKMLARSLQALRRALRSDVGLGQSRWQVATRAEVLWTLAQASQHQPAYLRRLFGNRARLDLYGRSRLLLAMNRDKARHLNRISRLRKELMGHVNVVNQGTASQLVTINFTRSSYWYGILLSSRTRTMAALLEALAETAPNTNEVQALKAALLSELGYKRYGYGWHSGGLGWGNTQNNAQALLALRSFLQHKVATTPPRRFAYQLRRRGQKGWGKAVTLAGKMAWRVSTRSDVPLQLKLTSAKPKQPLWVRARISYIPKPLGAKLKAMNRGLAIQRVTRVVTKDPKNDRFINAKAGMSLNLKRDALLEEEVRIIASQRRYHVVVEVPIAAGLALLNPALKTSSSQARPSQAHSLKPSHTEFLDDRIRFFFDRLPAGSHKLYFRARAVTTGRFTYPSATASLMYQPSIFGRSPGYTLKITGASK